MCLSGLFFFWYFTNWLPICQQVHRITMTWKEKYVFFLFEIIVHPQQILSHVTSDWCNQNRLFITLLLKANWTAASSSKVKVHGSATTLKRDVLLRKPTPWCSCGCYFDTRHPLKHFTHKNTQTHTHTQKLLFKTSKNTVWDAQLASKIPDAQLTKTPPHSLQNPEEQLLMSWYQTLKDTLRCSASTAWPQSSFGSIRSTYTI